MTCKIEFEEEKCIGCGTCAALCPGNWEMRGEKAMPKKTELGGVGCNRDAEQSCPVNCIHVTEQ